MIREITIRPVLNGFLCQVGCQAVVFTSRTQLLTELSAYLENPDQVEKSYIEHAVNKMQLPATGIECAGQAACPEPVQGYTNPAFRPLTQPLR